MLVLACDIQSEDGVANAAIAEAANRLDKLEKENQRLHNIISAIRYTTDVEPDLSQAAIIEKVGDYCDQVLGKQEIE